MKKIILVPIILLIIVGGLYLYKSKNIPLGIRQETGDNVSERIIKKCSNEKYKGECLSGEAISLKDMNVCNLIPEVKNDCFSDYGIKFKDIKACKQTVVTQNTQSSELCYQSVAYDLKDENICYNLPSGERHYRECFAKIAFLKKDKNICDNTGEYKKYCIIISPIK